MLNFLKKNEQESWFWYQASRWNWEESWFWYVTRGDDMLGLSLGIRNGGKMKTPWWRAYKEGGCKGTTNETFSFLDEKIRNLTSPFS